MYKMFKEFKAVAPSDFRNKMIKFWMDDMGFTEKQANRFYGGIPFDILCEDIVEKIKNL